MLINWKRFAHANGAKLSFVNLPDRITRLLEMYELEALLLDKTEQPQEESPPASDQTEQTENASG